MIATEVNQGNETEQRSRICPNCNGTAFHSLIPAARVRREAAYRTRFVLERLDRKPNRSELKDLTDFAHGDNAAILACTRCGVFVRDEPSSETERRYSNDRYDPQTIDRLLPRYLDAFRQKRQPYRALLHEGARVLEIGSHYGAFLQVATEWGWQPIGVDIGKDTSQYVKSKGYIVCNKDVADCAFPGALFDAVFVWNCFEQVPEPKPLLDEIHRILKPRGVLVVRSPNALFYETCEALLREAGLFTHHDAAGEFALKAMGYNNLLAFPYLYGYNSANLNEVVSRQGFRLEGGINSELLTLPLPKIPAWVADEQRAIREGIASMNAAAASRPGALLTGPWIELYYRAEPDAH